MLKTLSLRNAKRQAKEYIIYFITIVIAVALLYAFNSLIFSNEIAQLSSLMVSVPYIIVVTSVAIVFIIGWLVHYMTGFMLKKRSREFGTYLLLGIENNDIAKLYFLENTIIGVLALVIGMIAGSLISQIIKALVMNAFHLTYRFALEISPATILLTIVYWALIFFFSLQKNRKRITKMKIYDLIYFDKQNEDQMIHNKKHRSVMLIISVISGLVSLFMFFTLPNSSSRSGAGLFGTVLGVIFLYGFYISISSFIIDYFNARKAKKYKNNRLFLFRTYTSKAATMSIMVATLALLFTATMTAIGFGIQVDQLMEYQATEYNVYDLCISHDNEASDFEPYQAYINAYLPENQQLIYAIYENGESTIKDMLETDVDIFFLDHDSYMKQSDYLELRDMLGYDTLDIPENTYYLHCLKALKPFFEEYTKENPVLQLGDSALTFSGISTEPFNQETWSGNGSHFIIVVPDIIADNQLNVSYSLYALMAETDISLSDIAELDKISSDLADQNDFEDYESDYITARARYEENASIVYVMIVVPVFYVSFILMITAITILATQQLSDAAKFRYQYKVLKNLGMDDYGLAKTLKQQLLIYFGAPVIPPLLFSVVIIRAFSATIWDGAIANFSRMAACFGFSIGTFVFIYVIYFIASYTNFKRTVLD